MPNNVIVPVVFNLDGEFVVVTRYSDGHRLHSHIHSTGNGVLGGHVHAGGTNTDMVQAKGCPGVTSHRLKTWVMKGYKLEWSD